MTPTPLGITASRGPSSFRFAPLRRTQGSHPSLHEHADVATLSPDAFARGLAEGEGLADLSVTAARRAPRGPSSFRFAPLRRTRGSHPSLHERAYAATLSAMVMHADWRKGRDWLTSRSPLRGALSRGPSSFRFAPLRRTQGSHPSLHEHADVATLSPDAFARGLAEGEGLADLSVTAARRAPRGPSPFRFAPLRRTRGSHPLLHERAYAATSSPMPLPADWRKGRDSNPRNLAVRQISRLEH